MTDRYSAEQIKQSDKMWEELIDAKAKLMKCMWKDVINKDSVELSRRFDFSLFFTRRHIDNNTRIVSVPAIERNPFTNHLLMTERVEDD